MHNNSRLHSRLRNCLQTILELEPDLERLQIVRPLLAEFEMLKNIYNRLETILIQENDVKRIENATEHFLAEMKGPMKELFARSTEQRLLQ